MRGVISTSALEMGIDIGGLDVCILVGYPGTMVTTRQRAGRVGRAGRDSLIVLLAQADALDQYFLKNPDEFFGRPLETAVVDPDNPYVVKAHLPCAAQELPLRVQGEVYFDLAAHEAVIADLARERRLLHAADGNAWLARDRFPQKEVNIRGLGKASPSSRPAINVPWDRSTATVPCGSAIPERSISIRPRPGGWNASIWSGATFG